LAQFSEDSLSFLKTFYLSLIAMTKSSLIAAWILFLFGFALGDQICMRTQTNGDTYQYNPISPIGGSWATISWTPNKNKWVKDAGTNCAMRVKAYVKNYGWKYAFIDKHSSSNWKSTEYGQAYVSKQRVHEHVDSCFEMQAGFGNVDLNKNIYIKFVDGSCNDAAWIDRFFVPGRKAWGVENQMGWCFNGKKNLDGGYWNLGFSYVTNYFEHYGDSTRKVNFNDGCAREWVLKPNGGVYAGQWGSSSGTGSRSGRRALKGLPMQSVRFQGLQASERNEISLIEDLYDVCESYTPVRDATDRYDSETAQIVRSCFDMLEPFYKTYQEFQAKEDNAIPEAMRFASESMEETREDKEIEEEKPLASKINRLFP